MYLIVGLLAGWHDNVDRRWITVDHDHDHRYFFIEMFVATGRRTYPYSLGYERNRDNLYGLYFRSRLILNLLKHLFQHFIFMCN